LVHPQITAVKCFETFVPDCNNRIGGEGGGEEEIFVKVSEEMRIIVNDVIIESATIKITVVVVIFRKKLQCLSLSVTSTLV
jgi:hypothetical protein